MIKSVEELRVEYQNSVSQADKALGFWERLKKYRGSEGVVLAYQASALALKARHDWNPYNKLAWLNECMNIFKAAVKADPDNIEIRFLRFAIQHYTPEFLKHNQNLDRDKTVFLNNVHKFREFDLEVSHVTSFLGFFEESKRFKKEELQIIQNIIQHNP